MKKITQTFLFIAMLFACAIQAKAQKLNGMSLEEIAICIYNIQVINPIYKTKPQH